MRLGVLDVGSNSAQFLVVDASPGAPPLPIRALKEPVLLGEDIDPAGVIDEPGIERATAAIGRVMTAAGRYEVSHCYAYVTAAVRDAPNREEVLDRIEAEVGLRPQFFSGAQEARLTYLAVRRWYGWRAGTLLVLDIGGGSTELALGRDAEPSLALSLPLGAGRLTQTFLTGDPPSRQEFKQLRRHIRDCLKEVRDRLLWEGQPRRVVGSSKTFKQLARLSGAAPQRDGPFVKRLLSRKDVHARMRELASLPVKARGELRGVSRSRARQVLAGAMVADAAMCELGIDRLEVSPWALREGVVLQCMSSMVEADSAPPLHTFPFPSDVAAASVTVLPRP
ncbi:Ppx/GppA phosphatase family protein [Nocardia abscessus]|jgi:exopolyphosphatase / guanosine-5'-triphosphate,3'-diphosphate pyrophosphatase|uniref:Ppx/GppA phosphatase family protein n=1 Tax=Nocardia abscessus TaxID=120957 RepID=UPI002455F900|nr:Ppx/GppA phosphatase family protein [Nocardia abscessus]